MSARVQSKRSSAAKREREPTTEDIYNAIYFPEKRQRTHSEASEPVSATATNLDVSDAVLRVYQQMLPKRPEAIALLFGTAFSNALEVPARRVALQYRITKEEAIEELRRLLVIKTFTVDEDAQKISPTPLMDELWHAAILDTRLYAKLQDSLGVFLHHRPSGASEQESEPREKRLTAMKAMYTAFFSTDPLGHPPTKPSAPLQVDPSEAAVPEEAISINVLTENGDLAFKVSMRTTVAKLMYAIENATGIRRHAMRLCFNEQLLSDGDTMGSVGVMDGDVVNVRREQVGC